MKQAFILQGLDCAACAAKLQRAVEKSEGVHHATISFLTGRMILEGDEARMDEIINTVQAVIRRLAPGARMTRI